MTVATFVQPDRTTQSGSAYPANIDAAIAVLAGIGNAFSCHEQSTPNMTVRVEAGIVPSLSRYLVVAAQNTPTITAPGAGTRYDAVVIDENGSVLVLAGTAVPPPIPKRYKPLCLVAVSSSTTQITNSLITDLRSSILMQPDHAMLIDLVTNVPHYATKSGGSGLYAVAPGDGYAVAVGNADTTDAIIYTISVTYPGIPTITERANPKNFALYDVVKSTSAYVAVGAADGTDAYLIRSTDGGQTWTEVANAKNVALTTAVAIGSTVVAAGIADGTDAYLVRSTNDGTSFSEIANARNTNLTSMAYSPTLNRIVAVGGAVAGGSLYTITSDDSGATWTDRSGASAPQGSTLGTVSWLAGVGLFVCHVQNSTAIYWSADGITWTIGSMDRFPDIYQSARIVEINTGFYVMYASKMVFASTDGKNWYWLSDELNTYIGTTGAGAALVVSGGGGGVKKQIIKVGAVTGPDYEIGISRIIPALYW